jgi:hypothetical protein
VPDRMLGRANASMRVMVGTMLPLGALTAGLFASIAGMQTTMLIAAIGGLSASLWVIFSPIRRLREMPSLS